jgi:hypothetical protein
MASFRYSPVNVSALIKTRSQEKTFLAKVQSELLKAIKKLAIDLHCSVNDLLEEVVNYLLKKYKKEAQEITLNCEVLWKESENPIYHRTGGVLLNLGNRDPRCTILVEGGFYVAPATGGIRGEKGISFLCVAISLAEFGWVQCLGYC